MFERIASTALAAILLSTAVPAFAETMVKEVDVSVDLDSINNAKAAEHWTAISDDLENAIVGKLEGKIADDGVKISIDIDEVELANSFQSAMGIAESKLVGLVNITSATDNTAFDSYTLTVTYADATPFFAAGIDLATLTTNSKEYYDGMIATFADGVVKKLK